MTVFAIHISDGILASPWWLGGWVVTAGLALVGSRRIRDEEIPRVALLTSAFFVASLIHVRVGPTSVHLLLNGLIGVLLGWRSALAIPLAVFLQAVLFGHGGFTTVGINSCVMAVPAILAGYLFSVVRRLPWLGRPWFQAALVATSTLAWTLSMVFSIALLLATRLDPAALDPKQAAQLLETARVAAFHPLALGLAGLVALLAIWAERKLGNAPEFPLGLLIGQFAVLATVALNCLVLLEGGETNWTLPALVQVILHLPLAVVEGIVLGFTVGFLARVRPDMVGMGRKSEVGNQKSEVGGPKSEVSGQQSAVSGQQSAFGLQSLSPPQGGTPTQVLFLGLLAFFGLNNPVLAHRLEGDYKVLPGRKIRVESWFDLTGGAPAGAMVQVYRDRGDLLAEGPMDAKGFFLFSYEQPESLRVVISAGAGHRKELRIPLKKLTLAQPGSELEKPPLISAPEPADERPADRSSKISYKDVLLGITFLLALAAFIMSWRNGRKMAK